MKVKKILDIIGCHNQMAHQHSMEMQKPCSFCKKRALEIHLLYQKEIAKEIKKMILNKTDGYGYSVVCGVGIKERYPKNQKDRHNHGVSGDGYNEALQDVLKLLSHKKLDKNL